MSAGLHEGSGLKATLNGHIWSTFVIPRFLYGLEVQLLKNKDIENLEKFQRKCLNQSQGLPYYTSNDCSSLITEKDHLKSYILGLYVCLCVR